MSKGKMGNDISFRFLLTATFALLVLPVLLFQNCAPLEPEGGAFFDTTISGFPSPTSVSNSAFEFTLTPTLTSTPTPTLTSTPKPLLTQSPSLPTTTNTVTPTLTPTVTPTVTPTPTNMQPQSGLEDFANEVYAVEKVNCLSDLSSKSTPTFNACIFWKNPIYSKGSSVGSTPQDLNLSVDLSAYQKYPALIRPEWLDPGTGELKNPNFQMVVGETIVAKNSQGNYHFAYNGDAQAIRSLGIVSAFFWANFVTDFIERWIHLSTPSDPPFYLYTHLKNISINATNQGAKASYSTSLKKLTLGIFNASDYSKSPLALSGDIIAHELGHANLDFATNHLMLSAIPISLEKKCGPNPAIQNAPKCCVTPSGCPTALHEGVADYFALMVFMTRYGKSNSGEQFVNSINGESAFGIFSRDPSVHTNMDGQRFFNLRKASDTNTSCLNSDYCGEVHAMGILYTSLWYEVRKLVDSRFGLEGRNDIDKIFISHLPTLTSSDTFVTAWAKAMTVSDQYRQGRYSSFLNSEKERRGLR